MKLHNKIMALSSALVLLAGTAGQISAAEAKVTYRWVNSAGVTQYTETLPPKGVEYSVIRVNSSSTISKEARASRNQSKDVAVTTSSETVVDDAQAVTDAARAELERRQRNCDVAKQNLDTLQTKARIHIEDADGKRLMTDDERNQQIEDSQKHIREFCG